MKFIKIGDRVIDLESGQVHHRGEATQLSPRLLTLLNYFTEHGGRVLSRDDLIEGVWGHLEAATDDSVNVAVSALRRAIGDDRPAAPGTQGRAASGLPVRIRRVAGTR